MKKLFLCIVFALWSMQIVTQSLGKLEDITCALCHQALTQQEVIMCQTACEQKDEVIYVCLACAQQKKYPKKGLKKIKGNTYGDAAYSDDVLEHPRIAHIKKEERRKKQEEHLAQGRFPFIDDTVMAALSSGETVTVQEQNTLEVQGSDGNKRYYKPVACFGVIKSIAPVDSDTVFVVFDNSHKKTVRVFDIKNHQMYLPNKEQAERALQKIHDEAALLKKLQAKAAHKNNRSAAAFLQKELDNNTMNQQDIHAALQDVSHDAQGFVFKVLQADRAGLS